MEKSRKFTVIILRDIKMIKRGNIGVIVTRENGLMIVENVHNGLVYCHSMQGINRVHVCTIGEFWVLLDEFE